MGVQYGLINKSGAWYAMGNERIGQGRDNAITYLNEHPEMLAGIEAELRTKLGLKPGANAAE